MAGVVTVTEFNYPQVKKLKYDWLSHTDGAVTQAEGVGTSAFTGQVVRVECIPDTGDTAPDDLYDITLVNDDSVDVLYGQGANLSGTNTVALVSNLGWLSASKLDLTVSGAGSANGGIVYVYIR